MTANPMARHVSFLLGFWLILLACQATAGLVAYCPFEEGSRVAAADVAGAPRRHAAKRRGLAFPKARESL